MGIMKRKRERAPDHVMGAFFGGFVGVVCGVLAIAAMRSAGMETSWQNPMAIGGVAGSAIGARFPVIAEVMIACFQIFFP